MFYAISYDIRDNRRRLRVAKILKDYGERVQLSVFEADLDEKSLARLKKRLEKCLDLTADGLRLYPLCGACRPRIEIMGQGVVSQDPDYIIL
ncbi:MAG TPA: CRISPR-associated endonuclease Cas2 [Desulfobacterales bacterium]|nr:CRISPR-associated endonuclease Cas2 [Desulfobacterales bacterium]